MTRTAATPNWQHSLVALSTTLLGLAIVAVLYWAQVVFIPVGMALFLTFLLMPIVRAMQKRGIGRTPAVIFTVLAATLLVSGSLWIVGQQLTSLVTELPDYSQNITEKIKSIRAFDAGSARFGKMIDEIGDELQHSPQGAAGQGGDSVKNQVVPEPGAQPTAVVLQAKTPAWLERLPTYLSSALESLASFALALVLVIFMLLKREDLRSRFLRLMGQSRMSTTTKAVDDAGQRISRYLLMQATVNGCFGAALSLGLFVIGVKYAILWGFLASVLRYVPYIGAWIAAVLPIGLSLATFDTWWAPLAVVGLVLILELTTANALEPLLYGQSMGISAVAQLVSAAFWAFLWGPVGLVLSAPLTVVLLVLGKYVPQLEFLEVLLGDEPVLSPDVIFYQRLLARDQDDATQVVIAESKSAQREQLYDELLVPALTYAKRDYAKDELADSDYEFVLRTTSEVLDDLGERQSILSQPDGIGGFAESTPRQDRVHILACPARDEADRLALVMLQQLLDPDKWEVDVAAVETLTSEIIQRVAKEGRIIVCIGSLPPGGLAHTRYLCKRLKAQFPNLKIIVGRWGLRGNIQSNRDDLQEAGADLAATTLVETKGQLENWYSILAQSQKEKNAG